MKAPRRATTPPTARRRQPHRHVLSLGLKTLRPPSHTKLPQTRPTPSPQIKLVHRYSRTRSFFRIHLSP